MQIRVHEVVVNETDVLAQKEQESLDCFVYHYCEHQKWRQDGDPWQLCWQLYVQSEQPRPRLEIPTWEMATGAEEGGWDPSVYGCLPSSASSASAALPSGCPVTYVHNIYFTLALSKRHNPLLIVSSINTVRKAPGATRV